MFFYTKNLGDNLRVKTLFHQIFPLLFLKLHLYQNEHEIFGEGTVRTPWGCALRP